MAVTRKPIEEIAQNVRLMLNRPEEDDLYAWPEEYYQALSKANRKIYKKIAQHNPKLVMTETTKTSADAGLTYDLGDFHLGLMEVWSPPGPPTGERLPPANPDSGYFGWWIDGTDLRFTRQQLYSPIYIRWVPETIADLTAGDDHALPAYCEDMLEYEAEFLMANKQGFPGDPRKFSQLADWEWRGRDTDPSDMGILGTIKKLALSQGFESAAGATGQPWYRGISK
jgi:hypothetical protein